MRVLFSVYPKSRAHLYPIVPMAWALQSAGHEVRVATHAGAVDAIMLAGLTPVALGDPDQPLVRETPDCAPPKQPEDVDHYARVLELTPEEREHWISFYQILLCPTSDYLRLDRPEPGDLVNFVRAWQPDLVFWDATFPVAAIAAEAGGAAHARYLIGHDMFGWSLDRLARYRDALVAEGLDPNPLATLVAPMAAKYGVEVTNDLLLGQWSMETMLDGLRLPTSTRKLSVRHVPYVDPEPFPAWLHERADHGQRCDHCRRPRQRRVGFTLGESTRRFIAGDWDRAPKILRAIEGLDLEVIATLDSMQLADVAKLPDNVKAMDWVNLPQLLPTCTALIHHGGIGTYSAAVAAKTPQIVCDIEGESIMVRPVSTEDAQGAYGNGFEYDGVDDTPREPTTHWDIPAKKLEATHVSTFVIGKSAGARLDHRAQSVAEIRDLIWTVATDPLYQAGAQALHEEWLATPSPAEVIPDLERLVAEYRDR